MCRYLEELFHVLLRTLSDPSDEVVLLVIQVLAQIASTTNQPHAAATQGKFINSVSCVFILIDLLFCQFIVSAFKYLLGICGGLYINFLSFYSSTVVVTYHSYII